MKTDQEFYESIEQLVSGREGKPDVSLELYLTSMRSRARQWKDRKALSVETLYELLADSFSSAVENTVESAESGSNAEGFQDWDSVIERQIKDLKEMKASGDLEDEQRYGGLDAPSGERWYNFDPCTYVECATAGTFGGRRLESSSEISSVSWELFTDFLWRGQRYE